MYVCWSRHHAFICSQSTDPQERRDGIKPVRRKERWTDAAIRRPVWRYIVNPYGLENVTPPFSTFALHCGAVQALVNYSSHTRQFWPKTIRVSTIVSKVRICIIALIITAAKLKTWNMQLETKLERLHLQQNLRTVSSFVADLQWVLIGKFQPQVGNFKFYCDCNHGIEFVILQKPHC